MANRKMANSCEHEDDIKQNKKKKGTEYENNINKWNYIKPENDDKQETKAQIKAWKWYSRQQLYVIIYKTT